MSLGPWLTEEDLEKEARAFEAWMKKKDSIFFKQFAAERGYPAQKLSEYANRSKAFKLVFDRAKDWQEAKITSLALWKKLDSGMAKWVLNVHHDHVERAAKCESPSNADALKADALPPSKDLVNEK